MSEPKSEPIKVLIILMSGIVGVWILHWVAMDYFFKDWTDRGLSGDMFGSVNALFSGLALAGIIYTIFLQRKELQLQRHELELTRNELKRTAEAQEKSGEALREQHQAMLMTSRINAMNIIIEADSREIDQMARGGSLNEERRQLRELLVNRVDSLRKSLTSTLIGLEESLTEPVPPAS